MNPTAIQVGLRVDVDTFRGTRQGVPRLLEIFAKHHILASFFFSTGPDNMGRHLRRLLNPTFLLKMLRSKAANLYGWQILLCGTFWPGRRIALHLGNIIDEVKKAGHEVGLHAWDHYKWQSRIEKMSSQGIRTEIQKGIDAIQEITHVRPLCSAAAGWKCTEQVLLEKEAFWFSYNSDCRGTSIFRPVVNEHVCAPQIPVTLPTYDELIGHNRVTDDNYNGVLLDMIKPGQLNVLTIHAEVEGITKAGLFEQFLTHARRRKIIFVPLINLLPDTGNIPTGSILQHEVTGRAGKLCMQTTARR